MSWIESQLQVLTQRVETLYRQVISLADQIKAANQGLRASYQQPTNTTSGGGGMYYCAPSGSIAAASGAPGGGTLSSTTANVYKITSGAYSLVASGATIYNPMLSATTAGRVLAVADNGDGTYTAISQSCT